MNIIQKILDSHSNNEGNFFFSIQKILGFKPKKIELYETAFTHRSIKEKDIKGNFINYERLEFLGDSILSAVISNYLFNEVPSGDEGYLTKMRSKIVSREHLNELGRDLGLIKFVNSSIPKENFGDNIHGNVFEALIGAIYLDRGYEYSKKFIDSVVIKPYVDIEKLEGKVISYKSLLIEWCQKAKKHFNFDVYEDNGNEALKHFSVKLEINSKVIAKGRATSKKKAEEMAAKRGYYALQKRINADM